MADGEKQKGSVYSCVKIKKEETKHGSMQSQYKRHLHGAVFRR